MARSRWDFLFFTRATPTKGHSRAAGSSGQQYRRQLRFEVLETKALLSATLTPVPSPQPPAPSSPAETSLTSTSYGSATPAGLTPNEIRGAYGLGSYTSGVLSNGVSFAGIHGDGRGQTIAIVDAYDYPTALSDLNAFSAYYGLPAFNGSGDPTFEKLNQTGGTSLPGTDPAGPSDNDWEGEEAMDIEWTHAIAPMANIILFEATNDSNNGTGLLTAVQTAANTPGVVAVSMSWTYDESGFTASQIATYDSTTFTSPSGHIGGSATLGGTDLPGGVTFLAAAGDNGPYEGNGTTTISPQYPATSPNVVAVGGTYLTVSGSSPNYTDGGETAWGSGVKTAKNGGGGGGISVDEPQPSYQSGVVSVYSTSKRTYPDVSADGDPSSGVPIYDAYDDGTSTPWSNGNGGTSLSCPIWAGIIAIADEGRAIAGQGSLNGRTQTLPELYKLPAADFHDIVTGSTGPSPEYAADAGYDLTTGIGSPVGGLLIPGLVNYQPTVTHVSPATGPAAGGTSVIITGTDFTGATIVDFGNTPATNVIVDSSTQITATSPAGTNVEDVTVTGPGGKSATSTADQFTYVSVSGEILDNSQPGFWSTASSTWTTTASGLNGSSLVSSTANGSEQSQAAWWFSMPAGLYEISITYTAGSNLTKDMGLDLYDGVGNWIGEIPVNEQVAPNSFTEDGVAWENLGAFKITSNEFHISTWNSSSDGAISVNGIQLQAAPIIDDSNAPNSYTYYPTNGNVGNFTTTGAWTTVSQGAFGGSHTSSSTVGSSSSTATWSMAITPGTYEVDATWPASASFSASATYNVYDGSTKLGSVSVNQQTAPSGISYEGLNLQSLGFFTFAGTQLTVTLSNAAGDGQVSADAIRILPSYQPVPIVAAGYPGFWSNSAWTTETSGLYGQSLLSNSANGSEQSQAAWWFPVQPGQYQVFVTWVPGGNLSSTAPFDIYNALTYLSEPMVNEQVAPVGVTDQGVVWQSLGTFTMTSNVLHISTWNSQANGAICAGGIRIVPV
jgi:hypothetical protein